MQKNIPTYTPVRVVWLDSTFDSGWQYLTRPHTPLEPIITLGFVTHSTKEILEVSSTIGVKRGALNPLSIPRGAIRKLEILGAPARR